MSVIFEAFGYPVNDKSELAQQSRANAHCPFMAKECDGGGNRYMSQIDLRQTPALARMYPNRTVLPAGVCSLQVAQGESPWIVCPRRLLYMGATPQPEILFDGTQTVLYNYCGFIPGERIGIWPEVKIKYTESVGNGATASFDYTFDYVMSRVQRTGGTVMPVGPPMIIEVMTSSTSGGDKKKRTQIAQALEDCLLGVEHNGPGINYRQVWARMASQLIVKSQVALKWSGHTIWVLQDRLADYITASTALDLPVFTADVLGEVSMLAFGYESLRPLDGQTVPLLKHQLYAGPISAVEDVETHPAFTDIILGRIFPPVSKLQTVLTRRVPAVIL